MNHIKLSFCFIAMLVTLAGSVCAQEVRYTDASALPIYGMVSDNTDGLYERLPSYLQGISRDPVW